MPGVSGVGGEYLRTERFEAEAAYFGERLMAGSRNFGFQPGNPEHRTNLTRLLGPDGERNIHWQSNSQEKHIGVLFTAHSEISSLPKLMAADDIRRLYEKVVLPAAENALAVIEANVQGRKKVNGEVVKVDGQLIGLITGNGLARDGNANVHAHLSFWPRVLTESGEVVSIYDKFAVKAAWAKANAVFQESLAVGLRAEFGLKTEVKDGVCRWPDAPKEVVATLGTRRKAAIERLKSEGHKVTRRSIAVALYALRKEAKAITDLPAQVRTWNQQARQVLGERAALFMSPGTGTGTAEQKGQEPKAKASEQQQQQAGAKSTTEKGDRADRQRHQQQQTDQKQQSQGGEQQQQQQQKHRTTCNFHRRASQARGPEAHRASNNLADNTTSTIRQFLKTAHQVVGQAFVKRRDIFEIRDVATAIEMLRDRTDAERWRYVRQQLRKTDTDDLNPWKAFGKLMAAALKLYREGKKPHIELAKKTVVMVAPMAMQNITAEQKQKLQSIAEQKGYELRFVVHQKQVNQQQEQQQKQSQSQTP